MHGQMQAWQNIIQFPQARTCDHETVTYCGYSTGEVIFPQERHEVYNVTTQRLSTKKKQLSPYSFAASCPSKTSVVARNAIVAGVVMLSELI
ncbi:hypothetical protein AVEN_171977-1 [Araneus ventricosus]|uniref:Uncharacterized protein n=1 Tax=Araneus ventricosus TaxID=182803 RepID=A0A4Y2J2N3_ARAVE|nr:hypothetical protein AVEN_171977-1 [Araneus ventricosus]